MLVSNVCEFYAVLMFEPVSPEHFLFTVTVVCVNLPLCCSVMNRHQEEFVGLMLQESESQSETSSVPPAAAWRLPFGDNTSVCREALKQQTVSVSDGRSEPAGFFQFKLPHVSD